MNKESLLDDTKMRMAMTPELIFYTSILYGLDVHFGITPFKTAHVMGTQMVIDEDFFGSLSEAERIGLLTHEVRHIADLHQFRQKGRNHQLWNAACDFAINQDLVDSGLKLPMQNSGGVCLDRKYRGMAAEEIYDDLVQNNPSQKPDMDDIPETGDSDGEGDTQESNKPEGNNPTSPSQQEGGSGTPESLPEGTEEDIKDLVIQAIKTAERAGEAAIGNCPASSRRDVHKWLNPVVPWETILQRYMTTHHKEEYSWSRPNRRYLANKLYLPRQYSEQVGPIHFFVDASCSVTQRMWNMQLGQIQWIKNVLNPSEIRIITFNTSIIAEHIFTEHEPINVEFDGNGGTDVSAVVKYMEDNRCECNLVFTDGYFHHRSLDKVKDDTLFLIYDNPSFVYAGATQIITVPPESTSYG